MKYALQQPMLLPGVLMSVLVKSPELHQRCCHFVGAEKSSPACPPCSMTSMLYACAGLLREQAWKRIMLIVHPQAPTSRRCTSALFWFKCASKEHVAWLSFRITIC